MGRLFWKFFLFIWLAQMAGIVGVGAYFWFERQQAEPAVAARPLAERPGGGEHPPRHGRRPHGPRLPLVPILSGLLVSLVSALALAWYFAKPIRHLRRAFDAAAGGDLAVRVGAGMGGRRDELADLGRDFDHMTERLGLLVDGQKRLLHDVSHEMRSPLARLQAAIGLARQQPEQFEKTLERIEREGDRLDRLIDELLTLSRLEAGVAGKVEAVDMQELLEGIVEDARFEGAARQVGVDLLASALPEVRAHPGLLQRAIENVVRNALRHSPPGGVVRIEAGVTGNRLRLCVADRRAGGAGSGAGQDLPPLLPRCRSGVGRRLRARAGDRRTGDRCGRRSNPGQKPGRRRSGGRDRTGCVKPCPAGGAAESSGHRK
jgi:two-component system OmpR family sensor kinase